VDIRQESSFATLFKGPETVADVTVKAAVLTNEMPSPALLMKTMSLLGTLSALLDLSVGWVQTMFPSTSTGTIHVIYRRPPDALKASVQLDIHFKEGVDSTLPQFTVTGNVTHELRYHNQAVGNYAAVEFYNGDGELNYTGIAVVDTPLPGCTEKWEPISGTVAGYVGPPSDLSGNLDFDSPPAFAEGIHTLASGPHEKETVICKNSPDQVFEPLGNVVNAIEINYDSQPSMVRVPMMSLSDWTWNPDGSLERRVTGPGTFVLGGSIWPILDDNSSFKLTPIFSSSP
jgi:hypothetical protein